jgi:hypothetical protein
MASASATVYDFAQAYETGVPGLEPQVLNELHVAAGYSEANTFWSYATPIPDVELYKARWLCPAGSGLPEKSSYVHRPHRTSLTAADRRRDLDCDGLAETTTTSHVLSRSKDGCPPVEDHTSFDEWRAIRPDFQRAPHADFDVFAPLSGANPASLAEGVPLRAVWPEAEVYGGCAAPQVPRGPAQTWRVPVVLFGSPTFVVEPLDAVTLSGAPAVRTAVEDLNDDDRDDLWMEFWPGDLTGLNTNATELDLYAERPSTGRRILASFAITRVTNPPDDDGDGIQNACDVCPNQGHPPGGYRLPNGCPP